MAVEIPVVVDIEGAFKAAAGRVSTAVRPLQQEIDNKAVLQLKFRTTIPKEDLGKFSAEIQKTAKAAGDGLVSIERTFEQLWSKGAPKLDDLRNALASFRTQLNNKWNKPDFNANAADVQALQKAIVLIQEFANQRNRAVSLTEEQYRKELQANRAAEERNFIIQQEATTIAQINTRLSALRGKLENMNPKNTGAWTRTAREINKATAELQKYQQKLELMGTKAGSINRISLQMQQLTEKWNAMSKAQKFDKDGNMKASAQKLIEKYKELANAARNYGKTLEEYAKGGTAELQKQNGILGKLLATFGTYVSLHSLLRFAKQIRDVTGELEYQRVALGHLIQDTEYGATLFERIKVAAVESPFRIKDLVTYTKQLAAYRIETTKLFDTTKRLADVSAGLGVDMNRLILAYGQVRAASVLRGQELRQFTEAGIPLVELLADKFTELEGHLVSTADVFKRISDRAVPFSMISEIFEDLTDAGGEFYQMQETQAKTLQGRWEKLKDTFDIALQTIGDSKTFRLENDLLLKTLNLLAKNLNIIPKLLSAATAGWVAYRIATMKARIEEQRSARAKVVLTAEDMAQIKAKGLSTKATDLYTKALIRQRVATTALSKAFWKLTAAMLSNPVTAIAVGVAALATAFLTFRKSVDKASESAEKLSEWTDTIERQGEIISQHKRMDTLINRYERLTAKTQLTAKEQQSLSQTMRVLQQRFQEVTLELDNNNNSVRGQIEQLRRLNDTSRDAAVSTLQLTKAQIEQRLMILGEQEKQQTSVWLAATRVKNELENINNLTRKQRKELRAASKDYDKYGEALNKTSGEINTLQNRLVSIDNILNPQIDTTNLDNASDSMAVLRERISDLTNAYKKFLELQEYEGREKALKDISVLYPSLKSWVPSYENLLQKLEEMFNEYEGDVDATRVIEQAIANVKFDKLKSDIDDALKKLTDDLKKSETARNFFNNILDLTGSEDIAANITATVYGGVGKDFKERMQEELYRALTELEPDHIDRDLLSRILGDIAVLDVDDIKKNLEQLPPKVRKVFEDAFAENEKYNAEWYKNFIKTYQKAKTYEERINELEQKKRQQQQEAITMKMPEADIAAVGAYFDREIAKVQLEALKDTYTWTKAFEDLDKVSDVTLRNLIGLVDEYIYLYGRELEPQQMKELVRQRELAEQQLISRNAYSAVADAVQRLTHARALQIKMQKNGLDATEAYAKAQDDERKAITDLEQAFESVTTQMGATIDATKTLLSAFMKDEVAGYFGEQLDRLHTTMDGIGQAGTGIARLFANPLDPSAWVQAFSGLANVVSSIFGIFTASKMRRIDKDIEVQRGIVENLTKEYSKLEKAIANAFGSDYIHNYSKQLENLQAQMKAYQEQARLEEEKGRKADEEKIKEYQEAAESIEEQIADMEGQLAEFFTSTDVRSAAEDFAKAWIEAYKSFGSTTSAMKEKFQEMIESMITQSLAAKMMQTILDPLFREIDEMAKTGGELSAEEIATIAKATPEYVDRINAAMNSLMTELLASGYNVRQQAGGLTGIARSYATASEESINGLAAGVNTSLFYLSYVPTISADVAMIRAAIVGGAASPMSVTQNAAQTAAEAASFGDEIFRGQMQRIDENIAEMKRMLGSVITLKSANTNTHVVAVK